MVRPLVIGRLILPLLLIVAAFAALAPAAAACSAYSTYEAETPLASTSHNGCWWWNGQSPAPVGPAGDEWRVGEYNRAEREGEEDIVFTEVRFDGSTLKVTRDNEVVLEQSLP